MSIWFNLLIGIAIGLAWIGWRRWCDRRAETKVRLTLVRRLNDPASHESGGR